MLREREEKKAQTENVNCEMLTENVVKGIHRKTGILEQKILII